MVTIGLTGTAERVVTANDTAAVVKSGTLPVLATPVLSAVMEEAAVAALAGSLAKGETTVGGSMNLMHLAPTLPGGKVKAEARVTEVKGRKITFAINATDDAGLIGMAQHTRFIVDGEMFMKKAAARR